VGEAEERKIWCRLGGFFACNYTKDGIYTICYLKVYKNGLGTIILVRRYLWEVFEVVRINSKIDDSILLDLISPK